MVENIGFQNSSLEEDLQISAQEDPADDLEIEKFNLETEVRST